MSTGSMPIPNCFYIIPGYMWTTPAPGHYALIPFPSTMLMTATPNLLPPVHYLNYGVNHNMTLHVNAPIEEEPMHKLEPEKPMVYEAEKSETIGIKKEIDEVDFSDMPQLTRMDC